MTNAMLANAVCNSNDEVDDEEVNRPEKQAVTVGEKRKGADGQNQRPTRKGKKSLVQRAVAGTAPEG
jgi:hypothetical protein